MKTIHIVHLYAQEMNIYGDNGNVLVLQQRLAWRGIRSTVTTVGVGDLFPKDVHLVIGGGGQDSGQSVIMADLQTKAKRIIELVEAGVPMLMICGMYQLFGEYFKTADGEMLPGISVFNAHTIAGESRIVGNIVSSTKWGDLVGYENHSGRTLLVNSGQSLGTVKLKQGNNGEDKTEGAQNMNTFGSYLHGPVLAKSPDFADHLLRLALDSAGNFEVLKPLDDLAEQQAAKTAQQRSR